MNHVKVNYHETLDLRELFPVSTRYAFRKTIGLFAILCVLDIVYVIVSSSNLLQSTISNHFRATGSYVIGGAICLLAIKYLYCELYRLTFYYGTEGFRLVISRGVILRQRGSLPLLPVSEIYVRRNIIDMLCGLSNIDVYTPMDATRKFARIECLRSKDAHRLQEFLGEILTTQVFLAPGADEDKKEQPRRRVVLAEESLDNSLRV